jgi:hypothetical protein
MVYTEHTNGTIMDTMDVIRTGSKGRHLNSLVKYYIYKINRDKLRMNEMYIHTYNPILETLHELYARQQHIHPSKGI